MKVTRFLCDMCDDDQEEEARAEVEITLDGRKATLDVCEEHEGDVNNLMELGTVTGKKKSATKSTAAKKAAPQAPAQGPTNDEIRAWAKKNGYAVGDKGRIGADIRAAYDEAHP